MQALIACCNNLNPNKTHNMKTNITLTKQQAEEIAKRIRELDALEIVEQFRAYCADRVPGTYACCILEPETADYKFYNEPSRFMFCEERYNERGVLSCTTLLAEQIQGFDGSPDLGFYWEYCDKSEARYCHPKGKPTQWDCVENLSEEEGDFEFFNVDTSNPVDGWVPDGWDDYEVKELAGRLEELAAEIEEAAGE